MCSYHVVSVAISPLFRALETRKQTADRQRLLATMDPALKSYLDKLTETLTKANKDTQADIKDLSTRIDSQSAQVDALTDGSQTSSPVSPSSRRRWACSRASGCPRRTR